MSGVARDLNSLPLKSLKNVYDNLRGQPRKELSYKKSLSKSNRGSAASMDSRKETINLMINQPNTGLSILLKEASPGIQSSPSIFPGRTVMKNDNRYPQGASIIPSHYQETPMTTLSNRGGSIPNIPN